MTVWFTADLHLGHRNVVRYCERPFLTDEDAALVRSEGPRGAWRVSDESLHRHDDGLLEAINQRVSANDTLWVLGDFCLASPDVVAGYRRRIRCRKVHLVRGNHDRGSAGDVFASVMDQGMISVNGQRIWLNHYPMRSWDRSFHGSWHFYGHVHGHLRDEDARRDWMLVRDVGVDACGYRPLSFEEIAAEMAPRVERFRQWREAIIAASR